MSWLGCPREREVQEATAAGRWTADLRAHAATCRPCADVALAVTVLAAPIPGRPIAADPAVLWNQARLSRRLRAEAQVSRLVTGVQMAIGLALIAALVYASARSEMWTAIPVAGAGLAAIAAGTGLLLGGMMVLMRRTSGHRQT